MSGHIVDVAADKIFQVENMSRNDVLKRIEEIWENYVDLESGQMQLLSRTEKFQSYFENRLVVKQNLEGKPERRRRLCIMRMLGLVHDYVKEGVLTTTRHLFYSDVAKFIHQAYSDMILDDVCCIVGSSRPSLNTFAANRGVVAGCLSMKLQGGIQINCADYGYGFPIIPLLDGVGLETRDATFILFVEKYSVFFEFVHFKLPTTHSGSPHPYMPTTNLGQCDVANIPNFGRFAIRSAHHPSHSKLGGP